MWGLALFERMLDCINDAKLMAMGTTTWEYTGKTVRQKGRCRQNIQNRKARPCPHFSDNFAISVCSLFGDVNPPLHVP